MIKFVVNIYKRQLMGIGIKRQFNLVENIAIDLNRIFILRINKNIVLLLLTLLSPYNSYNSFSDERLVKMIIESVN